MDELTKLYRDTPFKVYPLLETALTKEDFDIWKKLPAHLSCIGNLVLETRDADLMNRLTHKKVVG